MDKDNQPLQGSPLIVGWREWCALPALGIPVVKAKIDTGARTSAIHAFDISPFKQHNQQWVLFKVHPLQSNIDFVINCQAQVIDQREIMSSNGHREHRFVIQTVLKLGDQVWEIELTLSNRDPMRFRLLLGREALKEKVVVDPTKSMVTKKISHEEQLNIYKT